jgi:hypothetical protein
LVDPPAEPEDPLDDPAATAPPALDAAPDEGATT